MDPTDPKDEPALEKTAPREESGDEVGTLRERLAAMEATMKEREEGYRRDMEDIKRRYETPAPSPDARAHELKQWEEDFERDGFVKTMSKYEQTYLYPNMQRVLQTAETRVQSVLDKVARHERDRVKSDQRCTADILRRVDQIAGQLDADKRSEPGVYREILDQVLGHESWAESQMGGGKVNSTQTRRGPDIDPDDEPHEPELSKEEAKWAKRWGMTPKEFKKHQGDQEVDV